MVHRNDEVELAVHWMMHLYFQLNVETKSTVTKSRKRQLRMLNRQ